MRREQRRLTLKDGELIALVGFLLYGIAALGYAVWGSSFFFWSLATGLGLVLPLRGALRRQRRRLERERRQRRAARIASYRRL